MPSDFPGAFAALREILQKHSAGLTVLADKPNEYLITSPATAPNGKPMWFACVTSKKSAVTFHLVPLYFNPKLQSAVAKELLPRKQGKTCFNFQRPDAELFAKLDELVQLAREDWKRAGFLDAGKITPEKLDAALRAGGEDPAKIAARRKQKAGEAATKRKATIGRKRKAATR